MAATAQKARLIEDLRRANAALLDTNAELERQTSRDTTTGSDRSMGQRGAVVADSKVQVSERAA